METLRELALILTRNKAKSIEVLDVRRHKESKINEFYYKLTDEAFQSDEEAATYFYPDQEAGSNYRKLKAALKNRMINSLFFIDAKKSNYTNRQSAYYECYKDWAAANILLGKNAYRSCVELCEKTLRYATQYEFTELVRDIAKVLRLHYGAQLGDAKNYRKYRDLFEVYDEQCRWEDLAERFYSDVMIEFVNNKGQKEHLLEDVEGYLQRIAEPMQRIPSYRLHLYGNLLQLLKYSMTNDYEGILESGAKMANFFEAKEYKATTPLQIAYYYQLVACTQIGRFDVGKEVAEKCLHLLAEGSFNWFKYYELYFLLAMHSGEYKEAYHIVKRVYDHPRMSYLPANAREVWTIFRAYVYYLIEGGHIALDEGEASFSKFRLGRFMNETPIFSKDKRGMNIAILVIQVLYLIQQQKYNVAIDKLESIQKYCARYLHKDETIRSFYFLKMLLCIPAASFHKVAVERKSANYLKKLKAIPLEDTNQTYKIEILPYEKLWELALGSLDAKSYRRRATS